MSRRGALGSIAALVALGPVLLLTTATPPPRPPLEAAVGAPAGILAGVALFAVLARARPRVRRMTRITAAAALVLAAAGASEEVVWRAFALARIAASTGPVVAVALTTVAFAAVHLPALRTRGAAAQLVTGAALGTIFVATGSLVACGVAHAAYNVLAVFGRTRPAAAISLAGVEKTFGSTTALHRLDLTVGRGELVALLGPNGAGKTTLASLVLGLRRPSAGTVRVLGRDPRHWRGRVSLGATPQEMGFPPTLHAREILELARAHAAAPVPLGQLEERFGLDRVARRQVGALSGGQRRRLALALAFACAPQVVVLDEPTTGLDVESRRAAWEAVAEFADGGGAVLLATHSLEEADALAHRIVVLAHGTVVADATAAALKACAGPDLEAAFVRLTA